jgi:hypothetical protein
VSGCRSAGHPHCRAQKRNCRRPPVLVATCLLAGLSVGFATAAASTLGLSWDITDAANAYPRANDCGFDPRTAIEILDPKVDFGRYQRLVLVLPDHNCGWAGQAQVAPTS